jgi:hypothetical protein
MAISAHVDRLIRIAGSAKSLTASSRLADSRVHQMTPITIGLYSEPSGAYLPSVLY